VVDTSTSSGTMDAAIAVIMNPLLALYTKFQGSSCLTHVGTEGDVLWTFELASPRILGEFRPQLTMSLVSPEDPPPEKKKPAGRTRATKKKTPKAT
jgi:hypothetical protein